MRFWTKLVLAGCGLLGGLGGAAFAATGPIVRHLVHSEGLKRDLAVEVGTVNVGFGRIWLNQVEVGIPGLSQVKVHLAMVEAKVSPWLSIESVAVHGGRVELRGRPEALRRDISDWRASRRSKGPSGESRRSREYSVDGLEVIWSDVAGKASEGHWWGGRVAESDGEYALGCDLFQLTGNGVGIVAESPQVSVKPNGDEIWLEEVSAKSTTVTLGLETFLHRIKGKDSEARPAASDDLQVEDNPSSSLGPALRNKAREASSGVRRILREGHALRLGGLYLGIQNRGQTLNVGPATLEIAQTPERTRLKVVSGESSQGTPLRFSAALPSGEGAVELELAGGPTSLASLGVRDHSFGLFNVGQTDVRLDTRLALAADGKEVSGQGSLEVSGLSILHSALSDHPVERANIGWRGQWKMAVDGSMVELTKGELTFGTVPMNLAAHLDRDSDGSRGTTEVHVPLASCQGMLDAAPSGLLPLLAGARLDGTFSLDASVGFDTRNPLATRVQWRMAEDCRPSFLPASISTKRFKTSFVRQVVGADKQPLTLVTGPGTPNWVPFHSISRHMETALLICEDGRFFHHKGFDNEAIANSIRENIRSKRFVRGASTISMQLAKNLYLPRKKNLSRKLQEAALTAILERSLSKEEILELYLNVVEFGPGIYGVGPAAAFYFDSTAADLSLGQSLYLASILPNPWVQHFDSSGRVSPGRTQYLRKLMEIAFQRHRIDPEELAEGLKEQVAFRVPYTKATSGASVSGQASDDDDEPHFGEIR